MALLQLYGERDEGEWDARGAVKLITFSEG